MRKVLIGICALLMSSASYAAYIGQVTPTRMFGSNVILFGITETPPADTCTYFRRQFKFDATTPGGKNMLSILMAAKLANQKVDIWYAASPTANTTETDGCTSATVATISSIGIR